MKIDDASPTRSDRAASGVSSGRGPRHSARELRRYEALFAARTRSMRSSAMRDMFALTERPEVISLAGGLPDTSTFSPALYTKLMSQIAKSDVARALQYGPTDGIGVVKDCIAEVMAAEGTAIDVEDLIVTTGGQQVLDMVARTLIDPGDVIIAEAPTYPGAIPAFAAYQADIRQVEMDAQGMRIDALADLLAELDRASKRPKLIYTVPNFQNPAGVTLARERREALIELARERELLILEDNPYGLLRYEGEPLPSLYSLDASTSGRGGASDFVIYLGTFSKILSPGLRLGWAVAPRPVLEKLNLGKQGADLCSSSLSQLFVSAYFAERDGGRPAWLAYIERLRNLYRSRRDVMTAALKEHLGEVADWNAPEGGLFIWATLAEGLDTNDLLARSEDVAFVPGRAAFFDGRRGARSMRLNFAGSPAEEIVEGIRRIGATIERERGLLGALTRRRSGGGDKEALAEVLELSPRRSRGAGAGRDQRR
ncbi:MAG TPA: PLP-dependent aminotransferase family protein [Solirubrobacteraceae bacterium]|nr:PLP-dependent aminotransferase family protein [Solirubrobacteraceae bacterium]